MVYSALCRSDSKEPAQHHPHYGDPVIERYWPGLARPLCNSQTPLMRSNKENAECQRDSEPQSDSRGRKSGELPAKFHWPFILDVVNIHCPNTTPFVDHWALGFMARKSTRLATYKTAISVAGE